MSSDPNPKSELRNPQLEHTTVLLDEAVNLLAPRRGGVYVDGTLGGGGHAAEILKRSAPDGVVIGLDQDVQALARAREVLAPYGSRAVVCQRNFRELPAVLAELGIDAVDGIVLDLGISWFHLRTPDRGFSFMLDGPLDMRMDRSMQETAANLVNTLPVNELVRILREYGEEDRAVAIARAIERARIRGPITGTVQFAGIVASVFPPYPPRRIHPATKTFQALRIAVNDEIGALREGLQHMVRALRPGGRIAVISFHSLEDRIIKQAFVAGANSCICPPKLPQCACGKVPELRVLTKRPVIAGPDEVDRNPAARSAKLRGAEKL